MLKRKHSSFKCVLKRNVIVAVLGSFLVLPLCLNLAMKHDTAAARIASKDPSDARRNLKHHRQGVFSVQGVDQSSEAIDLQETPIQLKASLDMPPEARLYPWNDMDLTNNATCGVDKCFFRSVRDKTIGYLVAGGGQYEYIKEAYQLAQVIQTDFNAKHFYLQDVQKVEVSETFQHLLNGLVYQANRDLEGWEQEPVFLTDDDVALRSFVAVQKVRVAPEPHLFLALAGQNRKVTMQQIEGFKALIPDKAAFKHRLEEEIKTIRRVLEERAKLRYDFQGIIDLDGNFYFMDIDSMHYQRKPHPKAILRRVRHTQNGKLKETLKLLTE